MLKNRYDSFGEVFDVDSVVLRPALRVNSLKISHDRLIARLKKKGVKLEKIPFLKDGYYYESSFSLGSTPEYLQGYYYLQDSASQFCSEVLDPKPGEVVLDMACAPGGKTSHIAQLMRNKGSVFAVDIHRNRLTSALNNLERLSLTNVVLYKKDARYISDLGVMFDRVLLDAPCSGNFCINRSYFKLRSLADLKERNKLQFELLESASAVVKVGGVLVYSTCSLEPEEDEFVVDEFLAKNKNFELVKFVDSIGDSALLSVGDFKFDSSLIRARRFWPHKTSTIGFFIAKFRRIK